MDGHTNAYPWKTEPADNRPKKDIPNIENEYQRDSVCVIKDDEKHMMFSCFFFFVVVFFSFKVSF